MTDMELLRQYVLQNSEDAFAALVARHVNLVFSAALRKTGNADTAGDITQAVFIILARKAGRLGAGTVLSGWLYHTARLTTASYLRTQIRRAHREQEAYMQSLTDEPVTKAWQEIEPLLEDGMGRLGEKDRNAIVLRFFDGKSFQEIGAAVGSSENAAKKRVAHALEKLRKFFTKRGVHSTSAIIAGAISANSIQAAPVGLAKTISVVAMAKGAAAGTATLTLVKGALKFMAWTNMKTAIVVGVGVLLVAGIATVTFKEIQEEQTYPWQVPVFSNQMIGPLGLLRTTPPQVRIVNSKYDHVVGGIIQGDTIKHDRSGNLISQTTNASQCIGIGVYVRDIIKAAYQSTPQCTIFPAVMPSGRYDYIANLPHDSLMQLREEIKKKFGLIGKWEMVKTNVLAIRLAGQESEFTSRASQGFDPRNRYSLTLDSLKTSLQGMISPDVLVVDQTGITDQYQFSFAWPQLNTSVNARKLSTSDALRDQLGLEIVSTNIPVEMLVVEKVK